MAVSREIASTGVVATSVRVSTLKEAAVPSLGTITASGIVAIRIGKEEKLYHVHKELLTCNSEYFRRALNGNWLEFEEGLKLEDVEHEVFNVFVHFLYMQGLPGKYVELITAAGIHSTRRVWFTCMLLLLKCYIFADRFIVMELKNEIYELLSSGPEGMLCHHELVQLAFDNLSEQDRLLELQVDLKCTQWIPADDDEEDKEQRLLLPPSFLVRVMVKLRQGNITRGP